MPLMNWDAQYSVHVKQFDGEHKHLFGMVNDLNDAMRTGRGKAVLQPVLLGLVSYAQSHFAAEESAMRRTKYPNIAVHVDEHQKFAAKVQEFVKEFESGNALISIDVLMFLRDWLQKHILGTDRAYTAHLNANGVA